MPEFLTETPLRATFTGSGYFRTFGQKGTFSGISPSFHRAFTELKRYFYRSFAPHIKGRLRVFCRIFSKRETERQNGLNRVNKERKLIPCISMVYEFVQSLNKVDLNNRIMLYLH